MSDTQGRITELENRIEEFNTMVGAIVDRLAPEGLRDEDIVKARRHIMCEIHPTVWNLNISQSNRESNRELSNKITELLIAIRWMEGELAMLRNMSVTI